MVLIACGVDVGVLSEERKDREQHSIILFHARSAGQIISTYLYLPASTATIQEAVSRSMYSLERLKRPKYAYSTAQLIELDVSCESELVYMWVDEAK